MILQVNKLALVCLLLLLTGTVFAATVNIETCPDDPDFACITSIDNIEVMGIFYDLTVLKGSLDDLFVDPAAELFYWGDPTWANAAVSSVIITLNSLDPIPSADDTQFVEFFTGNILHLPVEFSDSGNGNFNSWCVQLSNVGPTGGGNCVSWTPTVTAAFATFSLTSSVPVPAAFWLFGSGLLGLLGMAKRKQV